MYLKKLELCGFKSFADRTVLTFEQGVSAIIGPNGCGKSNTADAIRWCLGEQRAKSMRSKAMQDVIFGGTKTRAATGMAEVTLVFDNSQNSIPIDYSEVAITRRLFRSGESEYFINKAQCRLKDIKDLFLDTGIGTGGYSIIEQNKVEELVMANPETRREFFEEAAGVAKYKVRREETIHRLEKVESEMSRLKDSLNIYQDQIKKLDIQARKAKQYKKYQEELAKYEVAELVNELARGYEQIATLKQELEPKIREYETANTNLNQMEAELEAIRLEQTELDEQFVALNNEYNELKSAVSISDEKIKSSKQRESDLMVEQGSLRAEIDSAKEQIEKYNQDNINNNLGEINVEEELKTLKEDLVLKETKYNTLKEQLVSYEKKEEEIRNKLDVLEQDKDGLINSKTNIFQEQADANSEVSSLIRQIERLQADIEPSTNEINDNNKILEETQLQLEELNKKETASKEVILNIETEIENLKNTEIKLKEEIAASTAKIDTLKEMLAQDPVKNAIKAVIEQGFAKTTVSSIINPNKENISIVAIALGNKLDCLICNTKQQAEDGILYLKNNNLPRLTFIVLENIPDNFSEISVNENAVKLFSLLNVTGAENEKAVKYITNGIYIDDNKIYNQAFVSGGSDANSDNSALTEEQIKQLESEIENKKNQLNEIAQNITNKEDAELNVNLDNRQNSNEKARVEAKILYLKESIEQKKNDIADTVKEIENLKAEQATKQTTADSVNEKFVEIDNKLADIETEITGLETNLQQIAADSDNLKSQEETVHNEYITSSTRFAQREEFLKNVQQGQEYINKLSVQVEQKTARIAEIDTLLQDILTFQETETSNIQKSQQDQTQKETELEVVKGKREEIINTIETKNNIIHDNKIKVEELRQTVSDMEGNQKAFNAQKDLLETRIKETYGKTFDELKDEYLGVEVDREKIDKIKKKMEDLGQVNLAAQEEYDQLSQRYDFIVKQQDDLLKAKKDLEDVIQKINQTTIENFKKTFDLVRDNFKTLYKKLFGGGEADLTLTDENNLLETGVDIFAQPPGKHPKNILQCSGGEKTLTAIALLFAFFLVKQSPFCILDEVDAPLDDANVGRYINIIKEFSQKTQFLVVTHNKRTMEMADILYGVTMQELGISKIISVKMNRESEKQIDEILNQKNG